MLKKIVIIGPESTGKSTLCEQLAAHYQTAWVKEYAREYLLTHGTNYTYEDLLTIATGQLKAEDIAVGGLQLAVDSKQSVIFMDTDMYVMKVWCEYVFDKCHNWILNRIVERRYDLYLLCNTDLPWVKDELREYPDPGTREKLYANYKEAMTGQSAPWVNICGDGEMRLNKAIEAVDRCLMSL